MKIPHMMFASLSALVIMSGCAAEVEDEKPAVLNEETEALSEEASVLDELSPYSDVESQYSDDQNQIELSSAKAAYTVPVNEIILNIENTGSAKISYGAEDYLEKQVEGEWYRVPYVPGMESLDEELVVDPNGTREYRLKADIFDYKLTTGLYRIVKPFYINNRADEVLLSTQFEINSAE